LLALGAWIVALTLVVPSLGLAQTKNEYPLCWVPLAVGEVPNIPFSARLLPQTTHPVGAGVKVSAPGMLGLVARDSTGRVIVRVRKIGADNEVESGWQVWQETICDPAKGTLTSVQYRTRQTSLESQMLIPSDAEGTGSTRPNIESHTTAVFSAWHNVVKGRDNLGPETFEGQSAFRYRLIETRNEHSMRDVVNSDELFTQLAQTNWIKYPDSESEIRLADIRRGEPSPALFYLPAEIRLTGSFPQKTHQ